MFINKLKTIIKKVPAEIYIFTFAVVYRLPALGYDFINNDAYHWKERGYAFGSALTSGNLAQTAVTYHPGVSLLWSQFIANKLFSIANKLIYHDKFVDKELFLINHFYQKLVLVIITSLLITWVFSALKPVIGKTAGMIVVLFVLFEPFYVALSRAVHTDVLLSLFMILGIIYSYRAIIVCKKCVNWKMLVLCKEGIFAGVFTAFALLTKSSALFLIPFITLLYSYVFYKKRDRNLLKIYGIFMSYTGLFFVLLWPAMLVAPLSSIDAYIFQGIKGVAIEEGHGHMWFGRETYDPGILFYPVAIIARYTPLMLAAFTGGIFYYFIRIRKKKFASLDLKKFPVVMMAYWVLFLLMITFVSKKLDRYTLPLIFPMAILGAYYIPYLFKKKIIIIITVMFILYRGFLLYGFHPNYLAYYSPIVGGAESGRDIIEPKWLVGYDKVAEYFNSMDDSDQVKVAIADFDYIVPFANFQVLNIRHEPERDQAQYFVLPAYRKERNKFYLDNYKLKEEDDIDIAGVTYYTVYKVISKK